MRYLVTAWLLLSALAPHARADVADGPQVNYISADAVYLNVGSRAGLEIGARVSVMRDGAEVAVLEVVHVSSHSASCRVVSQTSAPKVGDGVFFEAVQREAPETRVTPAAPAPVKEETRPRHARRVRGNVAVETMWQKDLGDPGFSSTQPGVSARIAVLNPFGAPGTLRIRHRTRFYHRSRAFSNESDTNEWAHRLTEFGWYLDVGAERDAVGFGRVLNPYIRGLGMMDGGYVSTAVGEHLRVGAAGGLDPDLQTTDMQTDVSKYGLFVAWEDGSYDTRRYAGTFAFSGSYNAGTIDREFAYVQNTFSLARRVSIYHSMEVDLNRGWRKDAQGQSLSFSNTFATANVTVNRFFAVDASYDARRNIRDFHFHDSPDSLFDDALSTGYSAGLALSFPRHVRLRARAGIRHRDGEPDDNRHASASLTAAQFPFRGQAVAARLSISDTPFVTGYRPSLSYRFSATRRTLVTLGAGAYIYKQTLDTTSSRFVEASVHQTLGRRYFAAGNIRRIIGDAVESMSLYLETGLSF